VPYEQQINTVVTGLEDLDKLGDLTEKQASRSKQVVDVQTAYNDTLAASANPFNRAYQALQRYPKSREKTTKPCARRSCYWLTQPQGPSAWRRPNSRWPVRWATASAKSRRVGGALRTIEGAMPIRAAERFLTTMIPGIGTALQTAFPVFGAVAFGDVPQGTGRGSSHRHRRH